MDSLTLFFSHRGLQPNRRGTTTLNSVTSTVSFYIRWLCRFDDTLSQVRESPILHLSMSWNTIFPVT
jgi:hypothetical protein